MDKIFLRNNIILIHILQRICQLYQVRKNQVFLREKGAASTGLSNQNSAVNIPCYVDFFSWESFSVVGKQL